MKLIVIGAGGHGRVCAEIAEQSGRFSSVVYSDSASLKGSTVLGMPVAYSDDEVLVLDGKAVRLFLGVGQTRGGDRRAELFKRFSDEGFRFAVLQSASAHVAASAELSDATLVGHMAVVNTGARVGRNCIINSHALVEHDAVIADHVHVSTGAIVNGECSVGARCMIGSHATMNHGISICDDVVIGAGAVVVRSIELRGTYVGVPARRLDT